MRAIWRARASARAPVGVLPRRSIFAGGMGSWRQLALADQCVVSQIAVWEAFAPTRQFDESAERGAKWPRARRPARGCRRQLKHPEAR